MISYKKQQGAVLLVAIVLLLVITIIGVSTVNSSGIKNQIAGNSMFSMLVYQGAESTIAKSQDMFYLQASEAVDPVIFEVPAADLPAEKIAAGGVLTSTSEIAFQGSGKACPVTNMANAIGVGAVTCQIYRIDAESKLISTNARDKHIQGIAITDP